MSECLGDRQLQRLLDSKLPQDDLLAARTHIADCHRCQDALDRLTEVPQEIDASSASLDTPANQTLQNLIVTLRAAGHPLSGRSLSGQAAESCGSDLPPGSTLGDYRILGQIARGGSGTLYHAIDARLQRHVAIKLVHGAFVAGEAASERLAREARAVAALDHPNIVRLHDVSTDAGGRPYLVLEYVDGETLADRLARDELVSPREAATMARDLARALSAAHAKSLVHRDVKPANVLLDRGQVRLTDFGLVLDELQSTRLTREGTLAGTPSYMSPEQIRSPHFIDHRSDIFSLGTVLYEMLTGQLPFRGVQRMTLMQILHDEPRSPRELNDAIPRDLETICLKAMAKEPSRRYSTAQDLADDLDNWLFDRPIAARPDTSLERGVRWAKRNLRAAVMMATIALLLLLLAGGGTLAAVHMRGLRNLAGQQRDIAFATLQAMIFDVYERLDEAEEADVPTYLAQREVLVSALDGLGQLPRSRDLNAQIDWMRVAALARLGGIEYRLDDAIAAEEYLRKSIALGASLKPPAESATWLYQNRVRSLGYAHYTLGELARERDELAKAKDALEKALALEEPLAQKFPDNVELQVDAISSLAVLVDVTLQLNQLEECEQHAARCVEWIRQTMRQEESEEFELDSTFLPDLLLAWAETLLQRGEVAAADQKLTQSLEIVSRQASPEFIDMDLEEARVRATALLVDLARKQGDPDRASALIRAQQTRFEELRKFIVEPDDTLLAWLDELQSELSGEKADNDP